MKERIIFKKIPFWLFAILMIILFYVGIAFPENTNYWLVKNGMGILILEFLSFFSFNIIYSLQVESSDDWNERSILNKEDSKKAGKILSWFFLFVIIIVALGFTYYINIWLFLYFILVNVIRYFAFLRIKTDVQANKSLDFIIIQMMTLVISGFIALPLSEFFREVFSNQVRLLEQFFQNLLIESDKSGYANIEFFAAWGIFYFLFLFLIDMIIVSYEINTGRTFILTKSSHKSKFKK
jgi:hypothetical protein